VISVNNFGQVNFEEHGTFRLWGLQTLDPAGLDGLIGLELLCFHAGQTKIFLGSVPHSSRAVFCKAGPDWPHKEREIYKHLIDSGKVSEICSETDNAFRTCD
jgi:hypothetical protein